ncbi:VanW family protein [Orenia marismortui]|uniref:VanW family protein n=1 Tax=Orenia marismortui TaxID=46469 RepID=UPI00036D43EE|nr:VanW family protein [Orenia marismortui]
MQPKKLKLYIFLIIIFLIQLIISFIPQKTDQKNNYTTEEFRSNKKLSINEIVNRGVSLNDINLSGLRINEVYKILYSLKGKKNREAQNAFIFNNKIFSEKKGRSINIKKSMNKILTANINQQINLIYNPIVPTITKDIILNHKIFKFKKYQIKAKLLSHHATYLINNESNRRNNINISLNKMKYYYLKPSAEFSFNQVIGIPTINDGYKAAPIIEAGEFIPKVGGGICQVSSTLYNAVKKSNLKIVERHHHSKAVSYVPRGEDATIVPQKKDFRFVNTLKNPIIIFTDLIDKYVVVYIIEEISKIN